MSRVLLIAVLLAAAPALAQTPPPLPPPPPPPLPSVDPEPAPSPEARPAPEAPRTRGRSTVGDAEKLKQSQEAVARMRDILREVIAKLDEARKGRDVVKLNCVNEKLTQVKGLVRISEQSDVALQEAVARREQSAAEHEFTKVTIARSKVEQLRAETEECIGQLAFRTDENMVVEVQEPQNLPDDPTRPSPQPRVTVRPPPASPTR